jgi:hypothetical protein
VNNPRGPPVISFLSFFTEFEGAAAELKGWGIPLIKVDGTKEKELADQVRENMR